jgi:MoxR-like ATPase
MNEFDDTPIEESSPYEENNPIEEIPQEVSDFSWAANILHQVKQQIGKAVVGQEDVITQVLTALLAGGNVLVEGVPGLGKTLLVKALAKTFGGDFGRIQFTPDLMPSDVMGHAFFDMKTQEFTIRKGPVFTNILLADEINRAPAKTQSALLEVMQEHQVTIEGDSFKVDSPFMVMATQNPLEQEGTYPLPEAQLDRFLLKINIYYPQESEEFAMVKQVTSGASSDSLKTDGIETVLTSDNVTKLQEIASSISIDDQVLEYAVSIARATRDAAGIAVGAGPRGGISLVRASRAYALIQGRQFVTPDDIKNIALPVLRHRVALTPEVEIEGKNSDDILRIMIKSVPAPRQ